MRTRRRKIAFAVSVTGLLVDTAWCLSTFAVSEPFLPLWPLFVLLVGIFPIHFRTVIGLIRQSGGSSMWRPRRSPSLAWLKARMPRSWLVVGGALFVGLWVIAVTALWSLRNGGPDMARGGSLRTAMARSLRFQAPPFTISNSPSSVS
jgi:hypothetical protein